MNERTIRRSFSDPTAVEALGGSSGREETQPTYPILERRLRRERRGRLRLLNRLNGSLKSGLGPDPTTLKSRIARIESELSQSTPILNGTPRAV